jgi:predicted phage-related endonuclease
MSESLFDARRRTGIGGSDAAAVLGVGLYESPYSIWQQKVGENVPLVESEPMHWGRILERTIIDEAAVALGIEGVHKGTFRRDHSRPYIIGHPDAFGIYRGVPVVIEAKAVGSVEGWDERLPLQYELQVQHYLMLTDRPLGILAAFAGTRSPVRTWEIPADGGLHDDMREAYKDFWYGHVVPGIPPEIDDSSATADALRTRFPTDTGEEMVASPEDVELLERWIAARGEVAAAEADERFQQSLVMHRMGTATRLLFPGGSVSWRQNRPSTKTDWQAVARAYRSLVEAWRANAPGSVGGPESDADLDSIVGIHTNLIPGARPLRLTTKKDTEA